MFLVFRFLLSRILLAELRGCQRDKFDSKHRKGYSITLFLPALYSQVYGCGISRIKGINCNKKIRNYSVFELFARLEFFFCCYRWHKIFNSSDLVWIYSLTVLKLFEHFFFCFVCFNFFYEFSTKLKKIIKSKYCGLCTSADKRVKETY